MNICKSCGAEQEDGLIFCTECGNRMEPEPVPEAEPAPQAPQTIFCINCGAAIPEGSAFCTECGTPVGGTAPAAPAAATAPQAPKKTRAPMNAGVVKKLMMVVACIAAVGVIGALGMMIVGSVSPHAAVTKGFVATTKQLKKSGNALKKNVEIISIIVNNLSKANTQTIKMDFNLDSNLGSDAMMLNNMSPVLKIESDIPNKSIYADLTAMGFSFYGCAKDTLIGIRAPMMYGEKVLAVDTKTMGADIKKNEEYQDVVEYYLDDLSDIDTLSFCIFDKPQATIEKIANGIFGNSNDYNKVKGDMTKLLKAAISDLEVDKEGKISIDFTDKSVKGTEYTVSVTPTVQRKLLEGMYDSMVSTEYFKKLAKDEGITAVDIKEQREEIADITMREYKVNVTVDNKGRLVAMNTTIASDLQNAVKLEFSFNDYETLINDISAKATITNTFNGMLSISLSSQGNHIGKGGEFDDETQLKVVEGNESMTFTLNTDYAVEKGEGELESGIAIQIPGEGTMAVKLGGETAFSKSQKTAEININKLEIQAGSLFKGNVKISAKYNITPGVSGKANKFFNPNETIQVLQHSSEEIVNMLGGGTAFGSKPASSASSAPTASPAPAPAPPATM